ncbi:hypothetical protein FOA52_006895 [Chlamydomonas sp. UWO 241]|nr:hypothetical protein FOA52_006895 [Chlamydomonas sp. UWO 241]
MELLAGSTAAAAVYYFFQRQRNAPQGDATWAREVHGPPPESFGGALYYLTDVLRYTYTETLGRWQTMDLLFGLAYLSHRETLEHPALDIAHQGRCISIGEAPECSAALLAELHELQRHLLVCRGLKYKRPEQATALWEERLGITAGCVLVLQLKERLLRPAHALLVDDSHHAVVLCIRGTQGMRDMFTNLAVFDVLSDREEAQHQALWPAFLAAKVAGKRAQFHRARLVVDGERALQNHVLAFVDKYKDNPSAPDYGVRCVRSLRTLRSTSTRSTSTWTRAPAGPRPLPAGRRGRGDLEGVETYYERFVEPEQIEALHLELATLQLEPLPKKFESLYKVCSSRREEVDGKKIKIIITPASSRRGLWTKNGFPLLALCADRLLSMHATSAASERNWSVWGHIFTKYRSRLGLIKGEMLVFIRGNSETVIITDGDEFEEEISLEMLEEILQGEEEE